MLFRHTIEGDVELRQYGLLEHGNKLCRLLEDGVASRQIDGVRGMRVSVALHREENQPPEHGRVMRVKYCLISEDGKDTRKPSFAFLHLLREDSSDAILRINPQPGPGDFWEQSVGSIDIVVRELASKIIEYSIAAPR